MPLELRDVSAEELEEARRKQKEKEYMSAARKALARAFGVPQSVILHHTAPPGFDPSQPIGNPFLANPTIKMEFDPEEFKDGLSDVAENVNRLYGMSVMTPNQLRGICNLKPIEHIEPLSKEEHQQRHDGLRANMMFIDEMHEVGRIKNAEITTENEKGESHTVTPANGTIYMNVAPDPELSVKIDAAIKEKLDFSETIKEALKKKLGTGFLKSGA